MNAKDKALSSANGLSIIRAEALDFAPYPTDWLATARALAAEFKPGAVERDTLRLRPVQQVARLRETGLVNLFYPRELGGGGASVHDAAWSVIEIARADASIGALLCFHLYNSAVPLFHDFVGNNPNSASARAASRTAWGARRPPFQA